MVVFRSFLALAVAALPAFAQSYESSISESTIKKVRSRLIEGSHASWELGTAAQALLEVDWPALSVWGAKPLPLPFTLNISDPVVTIAREALDSRPPGIATLVEDGAAGDPPSIGIAVLIANASLNQDRYALAAGQQLGHLLYDTPRNEEGAISHRSEYFQMWSDFISMVPPFLAYFGAIERSDGERGLLMEAYNQIRIYREHLRDDTGMWRHVLYGPWDDQGHWSTGNGWACSGILRVLQTIKHSRYAKELAPQQADLKTWAIEIVNATWVHQQANGTMLNYADREGSFADSASTALLAACTFRLAVLTNTTQSYELKAANRAYSLIKDSIDDDGWLVNVVDPYTFSKPGEHSPEGQAFVLMLHAAYEDYQRFLRRPHVQTNLAIGDDVVGLLDKIYNAVELTPPEVRKANARPSGSS